MRKFAHVVNCDQYFANPNNSSSSQSWSDTYFDKASEDKLKAINSAYQSIPHSTESHNNQNYDVIRFGIGRSPLPETSSNAGLKINAYYYMSLNEEVKREISIAIETIESIISTPMTINVFFSEQPNGRLGEAAESSTNASCFIHPNLDYIVGGMGSSDFSRPVSSSITINPDGLYKSIEWHRDINPDYESRLLSPVYYLLLHEILHSLGIGSMWFFGGYSYNGGTAYQLFDHPLRTRLLSDNMQESFIWGGTMKSYAEKYLLTEVTTSNNIYYIGEHGSNKFIDLCASRNVTYGGTAPYFLREGARGEPFRYSIYVRHKKLHYLL